MELINNFMNAVQANRLAQLILGIAVVLFIIVLFFGASIPKLRKNISIGFFVLGIAFLMVMGPLKTKIDEIGTFLPGSGAPTGGQ